MAATKIDYLAEVLKQMQAKKTIKPDDAAKALTQYHKIQEQVRSLKEEIQLFKETQNKMRPTKPNQPNQKPTPQARRQSNISAQNGPITISMNRRLSKEASTTTHKPPKEPSKLETKLENGTPGRSPRADTSSEQDKESEKDKEIARLRWQNAQMKMSLSNTNQPSTGGSLSADPAMSVLNQKIDSNASFKLASDFKKIYDTEWKTAYHELEKHYKMQEQQITEVLGAIAREAFHFCEAIAKQQYDDILKGHAYVMDVITQPRYTTMLNKDVMTSKSKMIIDKNGYQLTRKYLKAYRKVMAHVPVQGLTEIFEVLAQRDILSRHTAIRITPKSVRPYMSRLIEVNWLMSIQDPPLAQLWPRHGQLMNRETFQSYGKKGATVIHTVWPALLLHKDGLIAAKGLCFVK